MLEKILDYQEKRKQKKKEMEPKKLEIYLIIFGIAIIILLLNNIFGDGNTSKSNNTSKLKTFVTAERLDEYFNKIKNNYEIKAKITRNDEEYTYLYETDGTFEGIEVSKYDIGYLKYKDNKYVVKNNTLVINNNINIDKYVNTNFCNLEFIKNIISKSECSRKNRNISKCEIKFNDLLNEYNTLFNKSYTIYDDNTKVTMLVYNSASNITNFKMDYRLLNNIISNDSYDKLIYNIYISDIDKVDYTDAYTHFPELFKK